MPMRSKGTRLLSGIARALASTTVNSSGDDADLSAVTAGLAVWLHRLPAR